MIDVRNVRPLSDFQRNAKSHIRRLRKTGQAELLTVQGEASIVVQDAASYQRLLDLADRARIIEAVARGVEEAKKGKGRPALEVLDTLGKKHGMNGKR